MIDVKAPTRTARRLRLDDETLSEIRYLVREGWVERLEIRDSAGRELVEARVPTGLPAGALAPVWAALGAIAALAPGCTVELELRRRPVPPVSAFDDLGPLD